MFKMLINKVCRCKIMKYQYSRQTFWQLKLYKNFTQCKGLGIRDLQNFTRTLHLRRYTKIRELLVKNVRPLIERTVQIFKKTYIPFNNRLNGLNRFFKGHTDLTTSSSFSLGIAHTSMSLRSLGRRFTDNTDILLANHLNMQRKL